ncbi:MAG: glycosyltransferase family 25 protein [Neisseriaceae bacterium]|nr:glycosyltransferase family 25 protein [Neisseriaceae bacterium]MBP6862238.1 glycosyltransferase family 25 protein [Neisseriaceae bacterium]
MNVFIVNLKRCTDKKQAMAAQCQQLGVPNVTFIEAVDGQTLSAQTLASKVYHFEEACLTKGEVGCALSHFSIYQKMVAEAMPYALILEDDVILPPNFMDVIEKLKPTIDKPFAKILSLGQANRITKKKSYHHVGPHHEYLAVSAFGTYAYLINLEAAKNLTQALLPIRYEADMFFYFRSNQWIKMFNIMHPPIVTIIEDHDQHSELYAERTEKMSRRQAFFKKHILSQRSLKVRLLSALQKQLWRRQYQKFYS